MPSDAGCASGAAHDGEPRRGWSDRRCWHGAALGGAVLGLVPNFWMLTAGTWNLFRWERQANFYDAQARSLLHGTFAMDARDLNIEAFAHGDQVFMYFGPFPSILRLPIVGVTRSFDGRLAALSMLIALMVAVAGLVGIGWQVRRRCARGGFVSCTVTRTEMVAVGITYFAALGGGVLLFESSRTWVYHEAIMWGVSLTLVSLAAQLCWLSAREVAPGNTRRWLLVASVGAGLAALSRPSVAGGAIASLGLIALGDTASKIRATRRSSPDTGSGADLTAVWAATLLPFVVYSLVNWVKFGRLVGVSWESQAYSKLSAHRQAVLEAHGGSLFAPNFVPTNLFTYLRPDLVGFEGSFPYIQLRRPEAFVGDPLYDYVDFTSGIFTLMPLLVALMVIGILTLVVRTPAPLRELRMVAAGAACGTLGVLTIGFLSSRYVGDFVPVVAVLAAIGLPVAVGRALQYSARAARVGLGASAVLAATGLLTNAAFGYAYQRGLGPLVEPGQAAGYLQDQIWVDERFPSSTTPLVDQLAVLPSNGGIGDVAVIGQCAGLYLSDGSEATENRDSEWRLVELAADSGAAAGVVAIEPGVSGTFELARVETGLDSVSVVVTLESDVMSVGSVVGGVEHRGPDLARDNGDGLPWAIYADPVLEGLDVYLDGKHAYFSGLAPSQTPLVRPTVGPARDRTAGDVLDIDNSAEESGAVLATVQVRQVQTPTCEALLAASR